WQSDTWPASRYFRVSHWLPSGERAAGDCHSPEQVSSQVTAAAPRRGGTPADAATEAPHQAAGGPAWASMSLAGGHREELLKRDLTGAKRRAFQLQPVH